MTQIGINVGEGSSGTLGGIEPRILWSNSGTVAGLNVEVRECEIVFMGYDSWRVLPCRVALPRSHGVLLFALFVFCSGC